MKTTRRRRSQAERWNEFVAAFRVLVRPSGDGAVDMRMKIAEGYLNLLVGEVVDYIEPHDLAAAFSCHLLIAEELGAIRSLCGERLLNALADLKQSGKLPLAVDPGMPAESAMRLNGLLLGLLSTEEGCLCYKRIASLLSKAARNGFYKSFMCKKPKAKSK